MFFESTFNGNISAWTPYVLEKSTNLSDNPEFNMPYWGNLNSNNEIRAVIAMKQKEDLKWELNSIINHTKHKIKL